ncbi:MAG: hypothetical protein FJW30_14045 [Acidobacteria bacterium]|nr:hypothetical protein [Acidobacteriota bacterium]
MSPRSQSDSTHQPLAGQKAAIETEKGQSTLKDVLLVAVPKGIGGVSQLLLSLVLIRYMGPASFGIVSVSLAAILLLDSIFGSAIDMAIFRLAPLYRMTDPLRARQIEKAGLLLKPAASLLLLGPLLFALPGISQALFQDRSQAAVLLLALGALLGLLMFRSMQVHFQNERRFVAYGVSDLLHTVARFGSIGLLLLLSTPTPERILAIYFFAAFAVTIFGLFWFTRPVLSAPFSRDAAAELARILAWYLPTVVAGSIASRMDVFFISSFGGVEEAGIFGAAQMFALVPQLFGTYAAAVFSPRVLPMWRAGTLITRYVQVQSLLLGVSVVLFLLVWLGTGTLGAHLLPPKYLRAREVILILLPSGLAALINFPLTIPLLLYTYPRALLAADLLAIPLVALAYFILVPGNGAAMAAAISTSAGFLRLLFYQALAFFLLRNDPHGEAWSLTEAAAQTKITSGAPA